MAQSQTFPTDARAFPPGPKTTPLRAMLFFIFSFRRDMLGTLTEWAKTYGDIVHTEMGGQHNFNVYHPDLVHQILVEDAPKMYKTPDYTDPKIGLARFLGNGLLTSDGEFWKRQRRLVAPALHARRVESYADTMVDFTLRHLESWRDGQRVDIDQAMTRLTLDIVAKTLFDADVSGDAGRIGNAIAVLQQVTGRMSLLPSWMPTPGRLRANRAVNDLDAIIYRIINERRRSGEDRGDLLSMLLLAMEDGSGMTDKQARDEAVTLFLAGHETTANALKWTWYLLSQNPQVEVKLHAEIDSVLQGRAPTLADLAKLPYTEMVVKEALRLYPPAYAFSRLAIEDTTLGGYHIPKGSALHIISYITHRDPRWWDEPERFLPERFADEAEKRLPRYAYFPFGGGPRVCIGNSFAMMEARLLLATIAQRYRLTLAPGQRVEPEPLITLVPKYGLRMIAHARQR